MTYLLNCFRTNAQPVTLPIQGTCPCHLGTLGFARPEEPRSVEGAARVASGLSPQAPKKPHTVISHACVFAAPNLVGGH